MSKRVVVESGRDRRALVADAGWSQVSLGSVLAGILVAYGAFALLAGIAAGILDATSADTDIRARWDDLGVAAGLVVAGLLFLSYLFGGYVAGRMARRAGLLHGLAVFVLGVIVVAAVAVAVRALADTDTVVESLRDLGLPTTGDEWADIGTVAGLASLAGALLGALLGGLLGERWHAKLLSRAVDPDVGAAAEARRNAELAAAQARVRHSEASDRVDTASLRGLRDTPDADRRPDVDRTDDDDRQLADDRRPLTGRPNGNGARSGWYRDRDPDGVPDRDERNDERDRVPEADAGAVTTRRRARRPLTDRPDGDAARSGWYRDRDLGDDERRPVATDRTDDDEPDDDTFADKIRRAARKATPDR
jgi:hypothetical protein